MVDTNLFFCFEFINCNHTVSLPVLIKKRRNGSSISRYRFYFVQIRFCGQKQSGIVSFEQNPIRATFYTRFHSQAHLRGLINTGVIEQSDR